MDSAPQDEPTEFSIDSSTGVIYVSGDLEREVTVVGIHYYDITVGYSQLKLLSNCFAGQSI